MEWERERGMNNSARRGGRHLIKARHGNPEGKKKKKKKKKKNTWKSDEGLVGGVSPPPSGFGRNYLPFKKTTRRGWLVHKLHVYTHTVNEWKGKRERRDKVKEKEERRWCVRVCVSTRF